MKYYGGTSNSERSSLRTSCLFTLPVPYFYLESEFWLALGKAILAVGVIVFTFVTMVGGNPLHDAYGFRNWNRRHPYFLITLCWVNWRIIAAKIQGAPFAEYIEEGNLGRFLGFLACLIQASFTIAGMLLDDTLIFIKHICLLRARLCIHGCRRSKRPKAQHAFSI